MTEDPAERRRRIDKERNEEAIRKNIKDIQDAQEKTQQQQETSTLLNEYLGEELTNKKASDDLRLLMQSIGEVRDVKQSVSSINLFANQMSSSLGIINSTLNGISSTVVSIEQNQNINSLPSATSTVSVAP